MKYTAGKVLRMFATSKGSDQMPVEFNVKTSFDFPGKWTWLRMNDLVLLLHNKKLTEKENKIFEN